MTLVVTGLQPSSAWQVVIPTATALHSADGLDSALFQPPSQCDSGGMEWYGCHMGSNTDAPLIRARMSHRTLSRQSRSYLQCQRTACGPVCDMLTGRVFLWALSLPAFIKVLVHRPYIVLLNYAFPCDGNDNMHI